MSGIINHPSHYNEGDPEVIDIINAWGLAADFAGGNVLKYFLRAPFKNKEEEDYRKAAWYLDTIYERNLGEGCDILYHHRLKNTPIRLRNCKINLNWFKVLNFDKEITLENVIIGWDLKGNRLKFIRSFFYQNFNMDTCLRVLSDIIDDLTEDTIGDDDL